MFLFHWETKMLDPCVAPVQNHLLFRSPRSSYPVAHLVGEVQVRTLEVDGELKMGNKREAILRKARGSFGHCLLSLLAVPGKTPPKSNGWGRAPNEQFPKLPFAFPRMASPMSHLHLKSPHRLASQARCCCGFYSSETKGDTTKAFLESLKGPFSEHKIQMKNGSIG